MEDLVVLPTLSNASSASKYAGRYVFFEPTPGEEEEEVEEVEGGAEGEPPTRREGFGCVSATPSREV